MEAILKKNSTNLTNFTLFSTKGHPPGVNHGNIFSFCLSSSTTMTTGHKIKPKNRSILTVSFVVAVIKQDFYSLVKLIQSQHRVR